MEARRGARVELAPVPTPGVGADTPMTVTTPMSGCRLVEARGRVVLFGQPPEVLKALLKSGAGALDTVVLPDRRERDGALLNNVEFLLYYFLFFGGGLEHDRRLRIVGDTEHIAQTMALLRLTLLGPTAEELEAWGTEPELREEWVNAGRFFAIKDEAGDPRRVESFFEPYPFAGDVADAAGVVVRRLGDDRFEVTQGPNRALVHLDPDEPIVPPYPVQGDYVPIGFTKLGVEVLGGASGFSVEHPSTGFVLCANGHYLLIDAIPFVDHHLRARGISRSQIRSMFLTHLHDDHCNMAPLMRMPHRLDVITTREIFEMAMTKLALGLGWAVEAVREHFNLVEVRPGQTLDYYGLEITAHHTVHSIPTIGAVFRVRHDGRAHEVCLVGDIQTFNEIGEMREQGLVRAETEAKLRELYRRRFDLLIADGGMGPIHGDPADALGSQAERVVFVHVESLPERFNATFSLADSGKRYIIIEADADIYTARTIELLLGNFPGPLDTRWLSTLFTNKKIKRFNAGDVIIKQGSETWGDVFLVLTGYCEVIHHDGERFRVLATREAGDLMGEMAVVTGANRRNASVVARTPVLACEFSESAFSAFVEAEHMKGRLLTSWSLRPVLASLPQFEGLSACVLDRVCNVADVVDLEPGEWLDLDAGGTHWGVVVSGKLNPAGAAGAPSQTLATGDDVGSWQPFGASGASRLRAIESASVVRMPADRVEKLIASSPQLAFQLRTLRTAPGC